MNVELCHDPAQIQRLASLAREIWTQHFTPIIGAAQVEYMLSNLQSAKAMAAQIQDEGYIYVIAHDQGQDLGYCAILPQEGGAFLSKLYVKQSARGQGLSRKLLAFALQSGGCPSPARLWLHVNKHNGHTIEVYSHMGFEIIRSEVGDIGNGFVMDDYIMQGMYSWK